jgi:hypothetical protein
MDEITEGMQGDTDKSAASDADREALKRQIADLKRDLAAVARTLSDRGIDFIDNLSDDDYESSRFSGFRQRGARAASALGHGARKIADTPTQNSISTLMIIAGLGVVIGMLAR